MAIKSTDYIVQVSGQPSKKKPQSNQTNNLSNKRQKNQQSVKKGNSRKPVGRSVSQIDNNTTTQSRVRGAPKTTNPKSISELTVKTEQDLKNRKKLSTLSNKKKIVSNGKKRQSIIRNRVTKARPISGVVSRDFVGKNLNHVKLEKFNK